MTQCEYCLIECIPDNHGACAACREMLNKRADKIKDVTEKASAAFWEVVAKSYPELPLDFEPGLEQTLEIIMESMINQWVEWNTPRP